MVSETTPMVLAEGHEHNMALDQSALLEALKAAEIDDRIQQAAETICQALIEAELSAAIGAFPHQRTETRTAQRNGYRPRTLTTTAGDLELKIPRLRAGAFFPSLLERRRRADQSLFAVIMEAYLHGTSTRKVDDLVKALGADTGISKSEVSRICADLDTEVAAFRDRSLAGMAFRHVFLDATYCKTRVDHRVVSQAVVVATGVAADGHREVLGFDVGDSEDGAFWTSFLRSLRTRGLAGVQLVIPRRPHRAVRRDRRGADRRRLAALLGALPVQRARPVPQRQRGDGRRGDPYHLRPARPHPRRRAAGHDRHDARPPVPQSRGHAPRQR
jgi:putative transposase